MRAAAQLRCAILLDRRKTILMHERVDMMGKYLRVYCVHIRQLTTSERASGPSSCDKQFVKCRIHRFLMLLATNLGNFTIHSIVARTLWKSNRQMARYVLFGPKG